MFFTNTHTAHCGERDNFHPGTGLGGRRPKHSPDTCLASCVARTELPSHEGKVEKLVFTGDLISLADPGMAQIPAPVGSLGKSQECVPISRTQLNCLHVSIYSSHLSQGAPDPLRAGQVSGSSLLPTPPTCTLGEKWNAVAGREGG